MTWESFRYTREQIYDAVWAAPMRDTCKQFGISDVALAQVCRKLSVPRPKQGYWLRRSLGQSPTRAPLPSPEAGRPTDYDGQRWRQTEADAAAGNQNGPDSGPAAKDSPPIVEEPILVPATLDDPHPLVAKLLKARRRPPPRFRPGFEQREPERNLDLDVSDATLERALRIMDGLLRAFDSKGMRVHIGNDAPPGEKVPPRFGWLPSNATHVQVDGVWIGLHIFEHYSVQQVLPDPPKGMTGARLKEFLATREPEQSTVRNGRLALRIAHTWHYSWRSICKDGKKKRIEGSLGRFLPTLRAVAADVKSRDAEVERRKKAELEAEKRRHEDERRRIEEEKRVAELKDVIARWRFAKDIRGFVRDAKAIAAVGTCVINPKSQFGKLMTWAMSYADRQDPLVPLRADVEARNRERTVAERNSAGHEPPRPEPKVKTTTLGDAESERHHQNQPEVNPGLNV